MSKKRGINLQVVTSGGGIITRSRDSFQKKEQESYKDDGGFDEEIVNIGESVTFGTENTSQIKFEDRAASVPP